jgi:hypothetical protein
MVGNEYVVALMHRLMSFDNKTKFLPMVACINLISDADTCSIQEYGHHLNVLP